jgi:mono/diheme cytochrome c family protein
MRSGYVTAAITFLFVASCGGDGYGSGSDYGDDEDRQDEEGTPTRDGGAWDARVKDGGTTRDGGAWDAGGGGKGGGDDDDDGAGDDDGDDGDDGAGPVDAGTDAGRDAGGDSCATLTYQTFGKQFMTDYCVSCHGGAAPRGGFKLDTLAAVSGRKAGVKTQVLSGGMPMGNKRPSDAERARLGQWIDCGPK